MGGKHSCDGVLSKHTADGVLSKHADSSLRRIQDGVISKQTQRWSTLEAHRRRLNPPQAQQQATTHKVRNALLELCRCNVLAPIYFIEDSGTIQWIRIVTTSCRQSNLTGPVVQLYSSVLALLRPYPPAPDLSGHAVLPISAVPVTRPVGPRPRPMLPRSAQLARCRPAAPAGSLRTPSRGTPVP